MKPFLPLVLVSSLLLAACGEKPAETPPPAAPAPAIGTVRFADLGFHPEREAPATVLGKNETRIAAEASARIVVIAVDSGDSVKAGQALVRRDARDAELALARAEPGLAGSDARVPQADAQAAPAPSLKEKHFLSTDAVALLETKLAPAMPAVVRSSVRGRPPHSSVGTLSRPANPPPSSASAASGARASKPASLPPESRAKAATSQLPAISPAASSGRQSASAG